MRAGSRATFAVAGWLLIGAVAAPADDAPAPAPAPERKVPAAALVVAAIAKAATENAARPVKVRVSGDALAELYVRRAATAAAGDVRAFAVGLVKALDPTETLAKFPPTAKAFRDLEAADEAKARLAVIGEPTLRGRNDRLLHFIVSAAIASLLNESLSNAAGLAKELADMKGGSGFSMGDLLADAAGIVFVRRLAAGEPVKNLAWVAESFTGATVVPEDAGLADSLTSAEFEKAFGSVADPRFVKARERITASVEALPYLLPPATPSVPGVPSDGRRDPRPTR